MPNFSKGSSIFLPWLSVLLFILTGCSNANYIHDGPPRTYKNLSSIKNAVPKVLPHSKYGNPSHYTALGTTYTVRKTANGFKERGIASWYGTKFQHHRTSSGERYDMFGMTAAMRTLPIPTFAKVTNLQNGRQVIVKVNDRGPFKKNRIIDLSYAAASKLDILKYGTAKVEVEAIDPRVWNMVHNNSGTSPLENSQPTPKLSSSTSEKSQLFLQIGSYRDKINAEKILKRLKTTLSQPSQIELLKNHDQQVRYRVEVGPFPNTQASHLVIKHLEKLGFKKIIPFSRTLA